MISIKGITLRSIRFSLEDIPYYNEFTLDWLEEKFPSWINHSLKKKFDWVKKRNIELRNTYTPKTDELTPVSDETMRLPERFLTIWFHYLPKLKKELPLLPSFSLDEDASMNIQWRMDGYFSIIINITIEGNIYSKLTNHERKNLSMVMDLDNIITIAVWMRENIIDFN